MRIRKQIGPHSDYSYGHGQNDFYIDQPEGVGQLVETRLRMSLEDYFLDKTDGTPYMTEVLGYNTIKTRDLAIQDRILSTQGVTAITAFGSSFEPNTRALNQAATIDTLYGQATVRTGAR